PCHLKKVIGSDSICCARASTPLPKGLERGDNSREPQTESRPPGPTTSHFIRPCCRMTGINGTHGVAAGAVLGTVAPATHAMITPASAVKIERMHQIWSQLAMSVIGNLTE